MLLEHLRFTTEWVVSREQPKDVDARFDLQDFISLNHLVEEMYQRTAAIEKCEESRRCGGKPSSSRARCAAATPFSPSPSD